MLSTSTSRMVVLATVFMSASLSASMPIARLEQVQFVERAAPPPSCYPLTIEQAKKLPGWSKLEKWAKDNYGGGGVNIVTNPEEYPDRGAEACIESKVSVQYSQKPECSSSKVDLSGKVSGTTQTTTYSREDGTERKGSWTVLQSSSITNSVGFSISVEFPGIGGGGVEMSTSATITNERSSTFESTAGGIDKTEISFEHKSGDSCKVQLETQSCQATATGKAPVVATGYVWFNFEDKRKAKNDPNGGEHFKFSARLDSILSKDERSSPIVFQGPLSSTTKVTYNTNCSPTGAGGKSKVVAKGKDNKGKAPGGAAAKPNTPKPVTGKAALKVPARAKSNAGQSKVPAKVEKKPAGKPAASNGKPAGPPRGNPAPAAKKGKANAPPTKSPVKRTA